MDALNTNVHQADPFRDLSWREALIGRHLQALNHLRNAAASVRKLVTEPIMDRVATDDLAIQRIRELSAMPLPTFNAKEEE
jgi:hypothetical protein